MTKPPTRPFNVIFDDTTFGKLTTLAALHSCPRAAVLRTLIHAAWRMSVQSTPTCADGGRCFVPQMHPPSLPNDQPDSPA